MSTPEDPFLRLTRLARRAPGHVFDELPPGLATRVLAQLRAEAAVEGVSLWERLSLASLPFAAGAAALCVFATHTTQQSPPRADTDVLIEHVFATHFQP